MNHGVNWVSGMVAVLAALAVAGPASAKVLRVEIERRVPIVEGEPFGERGSYELLEGRIYFGFDPASDANARVSDIGLAPRGDDGLVHAWSELVVLQPVDAERRSGTALVEVVNRGRRLALGGLNRAVLDFTRPTAFDPARRESFGDGLLMEQGLTLIWIGWQADAPDFPGAMRLRVPVARNADGSPVRGLARSDWVVDAPTGRLELAALGHRPHLAAEPNAEENVLTERTEREGERRKVARSRWRFSSDRTAILADDGFTPGRIYELVYVAHDPPLVGLGFAAFRDIIAYAQHEPGSPFPVSRGIAIGSSQSGRFLRHFLYEGFNRDESGRQAYHGVIIHIGGAGRGGFNHRFSHPGRVGNPFANFFYPGDDYPFASRAASDLVGDGSRGIFDRPIATQTLPKLFQINTGYEYWGRVASLIQMTPDGSRDLEPLDSERLYHLASAPHYPMPFPPAAENEVAPDVYRGSALDTTSIHRALLLHMLRWVEQGTAPPPSQVPRIALGTLVRPEDVRYPIGSLQPPRSPHKAYRQDFGAGFDRGIVGLQPPRRGPAYAVRVPQVDGLGSEQSGIRALALRAPIGSYLPWALRTGAPFAADEMTGYLGSFVPLAAGPIERSPGDARPSLSELYPDPAAYVGRVERELDALIDEGWVLPRDRGRERSAAVARWDWIGSR
jgi:hypothetical protein